MLLAAEPSAERIGHLNRRGSLSIRAVRRGVQKGGPLNAESVETKRIHEGSRR